MFVDDMSDREIRGLIKDGRTVISISNRWLSHGYQYYIVKEFGIERHFGKISIWEHRQGWWITAGCRRFSSPDAMRSHYRSPGWHQGQNVKRRNQLRKESLTIANSISRFAKKYKIKFVAETCKTQSG